MQQDFKPLAITTEIVEQTLNDEILIYDLTRHLAYSLNKTLGDIWKKCDGKHTVNEISDEMEAEWRTSVGEEIVWLALDKLANHQLLENLTKERFCVATRRQIIKRAALMTVITLPVLTAVIAPTSAQAQSVSTGRGLSVSCSDNIRSCRPDLICLQGHPLGSFCCSPGMPCVSDSQCCNINTCYSAFGSGLNRCVVAVRPGNICNKNSDCFSNSCDFANNTCN